MDDRSNEKSENKGNEQEPSRVLSGEALRKKLFNTEKELLDSQEQSEPKTDFSSANRFKSSEDGGDDGMERPLHSSTASDRLELHNESVEEPINEEPKEPADQQYDESLEILGKTSRTDSNVVGEEVGLNKREKKKMVRKKEDKVVNKIVAIVLAALLISIVVFGFSFYRYWKSGLQPLNKNDDQLKQVHIPYRSSTKDIGSILEKDKVIKSGFVFSYYVKMNNLTDFQAGYYQMSPDMTLNQIASMLQEGGTDEPVAIADARITVPEGYTVEQIADLVDKKTSFSKKDFLALMKNEAFFDQLVGQFPELLTSAKQAEGVRYRLEGYLFPATYNYYKKQSLEDFVTKMVSTTNQVMAPYYDKIKEQGLTVQEVLTLASLVEKEGVSETDRRKIAQVFFNRMNQDPPMPLQSDISVIYALGEHKEHLSEKDTQVDSPYNLYVHAGYGPGPFDNPGEEAIKAVIDPDITVSDLYFLADVKTGEVYFAKTYEDHLKLKKEHIDNKME